MEDLLDIRDLHLHNKAWVMLHNIAAFGYDGRLGHHPAKVHICTVDGQVHIAVPMYGMSPAKCEVIETQLRPGLSKKSVKNS